MNRTSNFDPIYPVKSKLRTRQNHERQLIGRALNCISSALAIADVLSPANFQDLLCKRLFEIILEGIDKAELDLMSITRAYNKKYTEQKAYEITILVDHAILSSYVFTEALLLLEMDIRDKFAELLLNRERHAAKEAEFESAAIWKQCHDHIIHPDNDVFLAVDQLHAYLKTYFADQMDEYNELRDAIPKLVERIKKRAKTRKFLDTLTTLGADSETFEQKMSIKVLTDWMIMCMGGKNVPVDFHSTINDLNKKWNV